MNKTVRIGKGVRVRLLGEYKELLSEAIEAITGISPDLSEEGSDIDVTISAGVDSSEHAAAVGARAALEGDERISYFKPRFAIYAKDSHIAILYDRNEYTELQGGKAAVESFINGDLQFDPNAKCDHHGEHHHGDHDCGSHDCGSHNCGDHGCH